MKAIPFILFLFVSIIGFSETYYVSSSGNDSNNGITTLTPWQTLGKITSSSFIGGDSILLKKGDTFYGSVVFPSSGSSIAGRIVISSYGTGAKPIINGFTDVVDWRQVNDTIWESTNAVSTLETCNMVVINGVNTPMGRYPNIDNTSTKGYLTYQSSTATSITSTSLAGSDWTGAEVVVKSTNFSIERKIVTSHVSNTLNWTTAAGRGPTNGFGFFIQKDSMVLDLPNEWYYNSATKKIRVHSTTEPTDVKVASVDILFQVEQSYITIDGVDFKGADRYAVRNEVVETTKTNITVKNCNVQFCGIAGIVLRNTYISILNNTVTDCNNSGVGTVSYVCGNVTISGNTVSNIGIYAGMGTGNGAVGSGNNTNDVLMEYNNISNVGFNGLTFYGNNIIVRNNYIDTFCTIMDDGGGIYTYTGGTNTYRDSVAGYPPSEWVFTHTGNPEMENVLLERNIIINGIGSPEGTNLSFPAIAAGIYCDNNSRNVEISYNSVYNTRMYGIFLNESLYMNVHHNTVFKAWDTKAGGVAAAFSFRYPVLRQFHANINMNNNIFVSDTINSYAMYITQYFDPTNTADTTSSIKKFGTATNNVYARPTNDFETIIADQPSEWGGSQSEKTVAQWKTFVNPQDTNAKKSPVDLVNRNDIEFYYNNTLVNDTLTFTERMYEMNGSELYYTKILEPYSSIVLINSHYIPVPMLGKPLKYDGKYIMYNGKLLFN